MCYAKLFAIFYNKNPENKDKLDGNDALSIINYPIALDNPSKFKTNYTEQDDQPEPEE